jgi:pyridoxal phosphate enzyme (YggS family)
MNSIAHNLHSIRQQIPPQVLLVAVSKMQPIESIMQAYQCGQRHFAESRPQELQRKAQALPKDIVWHLIGHLQTNKIRMAACASMLQSVDSEHLMYALERFCIHENCSMQCLMQVHIAKEEQKHGFQPQQLLDFFAHSKELSFPHIKIQGLMGIATYTKDEGMIRSEFSLLNDLFQQIKALKNMPNFVQLSMGMSSDYRIAIEMGSTIVRIGSAIFGERNY